jgi:hypothetical protein
VHKKATPQGDNAALRRFDYGVTKLPVAEWGFSPYRSPSKKRGDRWSPRFCFRSGRFRAVPFEWAGVKPADAFHH